MGIKWVKINYFVILLGMALPLSGCADTLDSGDLKDVELVTALAVDRAEGAAQLTASVQLLNRDKALDRQYAESYYELSADGSNLPAAIGELYRYGARQLNFSHASVLLLSEQAADCKNWLDYALRSPELRPTIYPVVCRDKAGDLLQAEVEKISQAYLLNNILEPLGSSRPGAPAIRLQNFVENLLQPGIAPVLPVVEQGTDKVELWGLAVYNSDGALEAILQDDAVWGYLWLVRSPYLQGYTIELPHKAVLQVENAYIKAEVWPDVANAAAEVHFQLELRAQLLNNPEGLSQQQLQEFTEERLQQYLAVALQESRRQQQDFLGLGREIYRQQPQLWVRLQEQPYLNFVKASLSVEAEILQA